LALDIGASKLVLAEFSTRGPVAPVLLKFAVGELPTESEGESDSSAYIIATLRDLMRTNGFKPAPLLMTLPGQTVFPRYVKLPPVSPDKLADMVAYEAEQNVPFPINEVVWDYQVVGETDGTELNALLVAVKRDNVKELTDCVAAAGLEPEVVDAAPMALYNAVRYNYPDAEGCTMVLDIGARSTNLIFIEGGKLFTRSIPVAGNTITQEIAKSLGISPRDAEALKRQVGFVALGGVYAMTDDERADRVSKVIRNVVTRLHAEVNRSINFYRSQQGGTVPQRVLLTGGTSLMPHMDTFFREKLQVDVDFFNPFVNVTVDEAIESTGPADTSQLLQLGSVVGLALRRAMHCPVEINLLPPDLVAQKALRRRVPYFVLSAVGVVLAMICWYLYAQQLSRGNEAQKAVVQTRLKDIEVVQREVKTLKDEQDAYAGKAALLQAMANNRNAYARALEAIRSELLPGMWITRLTAAKRVEGSVGYDRLVVEGLAYEDELLKIDASGGVAAIDKLLTQLVGGNGALFAKDGSRVQRTLLKDRVFREFAVELQLRQPLGLPTVQPKQAPGAE
jgi:type IV pilus assembly protein PilM